MGLASFNSLYPVFRGRPFARLRAGGSRFGLNTCRYEITTLTRKSGPTNSQGGMSDTCYRLNWSEKNYARQFRRTVKSL